MQGQLLGFQFLIKVLKPFRDFICFNCKGTVFHITGPKYLSVHFPYNSVLTFGTLKSDLERMGLVTSFFVNISENKFVDNPFATLYISIARD